MFISRRAYQDLQDELTKARSEVIAQVNANRMLEATLNWMRHRITQMEAERAVMIHRVFDVKIPTPTFETQSTLNAADKFMQDMKENNLFAPLSDREAAEQGIGWDEEGRLRDLKN